MCHCGRERLYGLLTMLPVDDLKDLRDNGPFPVEMRCHNCNTPYEFSREEIEEIYGSRYPNNLALREGGVHRVARLQELPNVNEPYSRITRSRLADLNAENSPFNTSSLLLRRLGGLLLQALDHLVDRHSAGGHGRGVDFQQPFPGADGARGVLQVVEEDDSLVEPRNLVFGVDGDGLVEGLDRIVRPPVLALHDPHVRPDVGIVRLEF